MSLFSSSGRLVRWLKFTQFRQLSNGSGPRASESLRQVRQSQAIRYLLFGGGSALAFLIWKSQLNKVNALNAKKLREHDPHEKAVKLTARERRFIKFASVEFDGQLFMTPQDFLDSVVEQEPRPRLKRKCLSLQDINQIKDQTPVLKNGSSSLFRSLRDKGIVSYTEYLFLLSILTKPHSAFRIAFNMFDTDGNQRVDKHEFLVIRDLLGGSLRERELDEDTRRAMERIFSYAWREKRGVDQDEQQDHYIDHEQGLQRKHKVDTTLQVHFFGKKGDRDLRYEGFYKFMDDLQTEVLELEFSEFSKGNLQITEVDFAKILLRYTYLDTDEYDMYLDRLLDRIKDEKGVSFKEFRDFCQFLNNLDDFSIAMRMYTLADQSISKEEFSRAVRICTGCSLTPHLIDTVFAIFDEDGDGLLSYKEFIAIMKDRLHRGFKVSVYGIEFIEDFPEPDEDSLNPWAYFRSRACRKVRRHIYGNQ